jgi:hypothetical protein
LVGLLGAGIMITVTPSFEVMHKSYFPRVLALSLKLDCDKEVNKVWRGIMIFEGR